MALITAFLRFVSLIFFGFSLLFFYSSYKDSQYLNFVGFDPKAFDAVNSTGFGAVIIRSLAALHLLVSTVTGYGATFSDHSNKKKICRGLFLFSAFIAYQNVNELALQTQNFAKLDLEALDKKLLFRIGASVVFALESFIFSFVTCGGAKPVPTKKKTQ